MNIWAALDEDSKDQEDDSSEDEPELFLQGVLMVMFVRLMGLVIVMMVTFVVVIMMVMFVAP